LKKLPTLGIYGDSFASQLLPNLISWVDVLRENYHIDNWAKSGSSVSYSYCRFKEFHINYDKNIFLVTHPLRRWISDLFEPSHPLWEYSFFSGVVDSENSLKYFQRYFPENIRAVNTCKSMIDYYTYLQDDLIDLHSVASMVRHIRDLRPETLLINAIPFNEELSDYVGHKHSLSDIYDLENNALGLTREYLESIHDYRPCHFTEENNLILGKKILEWLEESKVTINLNDFHLPTDVKDFKNKYIRERTNDYLGN